MALLIDLVIMLLLIGTLVYASLVDRRVRALMSAMQSLAPLVDQFSAAVDRTEDSVKSLRTETTNRAASKRDEEPPLTRTAAMPPAQQAEEAAMFRSSRMAEQPDAAAQLAQLPAGVARVSGKSDLVRSFFDSVRSREA